MKQAAAYFWPTIVFLLIVAGAVVFATPQPGQMKQPPKFTHRQVGPWIEIDRFDSQGNLIRFTSKGITAVAVQRSGTAADTQFDAVNISHSSGQIRIDARSPEHARELFDFICEAVK